MSHPQEIVNAKLQNIYDIGSADSIRDYGGVWNVGGKYLIEGAKVLSCKSAMMVDSLPFVVAPEVYGDGEIKFTYSTVDFRNSFVYENFDIRDVSILYDVLLHQDNYTEVIKNVISKTNKFICVAQPVLKESFFKLTCGCVLLQFYTQEQKKELLPKGTPDAHCETFDTSNWMWGQTMSHLIAVFKGYGWKLSTGKTLSMDDNWDYAIMRFEPK